MIQRTVPVRVCGWLFSMLAAIIFVSGPAMAATARDIDTNGDGKIDFDDFVHFASKFGLTAEEVSPGQPFYDWDDSGRVDFADFMIFAMFYGQSYGPQYPIFSLSGLSDTLAVGRQDTLRIALAKSSTLIGCDVFGFSISKISGTHEIEVVWLGPEDGPDSTIVRYQLTVQGVGEYLFSVKVDACGRDSRETFKIVGVESPKH